MTPPEELWVGGQGGAEGDVARLWLTGILFQCLLSLSRSVRSW